MILLLLGCAEVPDTSCGGTMTRTTWTSGDVHVIVDGADTADADASLEYTDLDGHYTVRTSAPMVFGSCDETEDIDVEWYEGDVSAFVGIDGDRFGGSMRTVLRGAGTDGETVPIDIVLHSRGDIDACSGTETPSVAVTWSFATEPATEEESPLYCL